MHLLLCMLPISPMFLHLFSNSFLLAGQHFLLIPFNFFASHFFSPPPFFVLGVECLVVPITILFLIKVEK
ncbi:hypothetical protein V8D89_005574 [Ganoderma adspersum]